MPSTRCLAQRLSRRARAHPGPSQEANARLLAHINSIHADRHTHCYGSPRMTRELQGLGLACSENRVARLMRSGGLRARPRKPFRPKTTRPDHAAHPSPNLLAKRYPREMAAPEIEAFLTHLAVNRGVGAVSRNQALYALLFLYREV